MCTPSNNMLHYSPMHMQCIVMQYACSTYACMLIYKHVVIISVFPVLCHLYLVPGPSFFVFLCVVIFLLIVLLQLRVRDVNSYWMMQLLTRIMVCHTQYLEQASMKIISSYTRIVCLKSFMNILSVLPTSMKKQSTLEESVGTFFSILGSSLCLCKGFWWRECLYPLSTSPYWHAAL